MHTDIKTTHRLKTNTFLASILESKIQKILGKTKKMSHDVFMQLKHIYKCIVKSEPYNDYTQHIYTFY